MPAKLDNPFGESCCDGGECSVNDFSAQSCGCDKGANWICERHKREGVTAMSPQKPYIIFSVVNLPDGSPAVSISPEILTGSSDIKDQALSLMRLLCNLDDEGTAYLMSLAEGAVSSLEVQVKEQQ